MANNISSVLNNKYRLSGMASGLDTDSIVKQLMSIERTKVDRVKQSKDLLAWKRDNYREITNTLRGFQDDFFNFLKPSNNMRSLNTYNIYSASSSNSAVATASGSAGVTGTSHTLEVIGLAKAATGTSTAAVTNGLSGDVVEGFNIDGYNKTLVLTYNDISRDITIPDGNYADAAALLGDGTDGKLAQLVQQAFNGNVTVNNVGGKLQFSTANSSDVLTIATKPMTGDNLLGTLGLSSSGVGTALSFTSPLSIKKGMKFEITTVEAGISTNNVIQWDMDKNYASIDELKSDLQTRIDNALGAAGKLSVTASDNKLSITAGAGVDSFSLSNSDIVKDLGFISGDSNKLNYSDTMDTVSNKLLNGGISFDGSGKFTLTINATDIEVNKTDSLSTFVSKVNNSAAGVTMNYSAFTDTFTLAAKDTGAGNITINDNGSNFFSLINLTSAVIQPGQDASFKLDGAAGNRSTNSFSIDGVTYNMVSTGTTSVTLTQNTEQVFNNIKAFVDKYNEVIDKLNNELAEKYDRNYTPLTDEQKESMSEDSIKKWEEKAKTGLLRNDSMLNDIVTKMRSALSDTITDISGGLSSIGISTGSYLDMGKLVIDDVKLKDAIKNNPDKVSSIFSKESTIQYKDVINGTASRTDRYNQNGIVSRLYDILQDNIRTIRDKDGNKGLLLEKAGVVGDLSEFQNLMDKDIDEKSKTIDELSAKLSDKEDSYYKKFAALEKAMSQMNSQSAWLTQQFGGGK